MTPTPAELAAIDQEIASHRALVEYILNTFDESFHEYENDAFEQASSAMKIILDLDDLMLAAHKKQEVEDPDELTHTKMLTLMGIMLLVLAEEIHQDKN